MNALIIISSGIYGQGYEVEIAFHKCINHDLVNHVGDVVISHTRRINEAEGWVKLINAEGYGVNTGLIKRRLEQNGFEAVIIDRIGKKGD